MELLKTSDEIWEEGKKKFIEERLDYPSEEFLTINFRQEFLSQKNGKPLPENIQKKKIVSEIKYLMDLVNEEIFGGNYFRVFKKNRNGLITGVGTFEKGLSDFLHVHLMIGNLKDNPERKNDLTLREALDKVIPKLKNRPFTKEATNIKPIYNEEDLQAYITKQVDKNKRDLDYLKIDRSTIETLEFTLLSKDNFSYNH